MKKKIDVTKHKTIKDVPDGTWRRFKSRCATLDVTMTSAFVEAVDDWLTKTQHEAR